MFHEAPALPIIARDPPKTSAAAARGSRSLAYSVGIRAQKLSAEGSRDSEEPNDKAE